MVHQIVGIQCFYPNLEKKINDIREKRRIPTGIIALVDGFGVIHLTNSQSFFIIANCHCLWSYYYGICLLLLFSEIVQFCFHCLIFHIFTHSLNFSQLTTQLRLYFLSIRNPLSHTRLRRLYLSFVIKRTKFLLDIVK